MGNPCEMEPNNIDYSIVSANTTTSSQEKDNSDKEKSNFKMKDEMKREAATVLSVSDFPFICRICLARADVKPLEHTLSELFHKITSIKLSPNGSLPTNICSNCIKQMQTIWDFIELSKISQEILQNAYKKKPSIQEFSDSNAEENSWGPALMNEDNSMEQSYVGRGNELNIKSDPHLKSETDEYRDPKTISEFPTFSSRNQHDCKVNPNLESTKGNENKSGEYQCNICGKSFKLLRFYQRHVAKHENNRKEKYECGICSEIFSMKSSLETHMQLHIKGASVNSSIDTNLPKENTNADGLSCEFCGKPFLSKKSLYDHMSVHTKKFQCEICEKICTKRFHLDNHRILHTGEKPFQCAFCDKSFRLKSARKAHQRVHTGERPYKCRVCQKAFAQKSNVVEHERRHTGHKPHLCRICPERFVQKRHLTRHERTHIQGRATHGVVNGGIQETSEIGEENTSGSGRISGDSEPPGPSDNECRVCGKIFSSKYNMQSHLVIHNESRDFLCPICGKEFSKKVYLDTHALIHSGEKPYQCKECGKSFRQRSTYNRHVLVHTDERSFRCDQCDKTFQQKTHLTRHRMVHTGEKRFECGYCGKKFGQNVNLKAHVRTHTGETAFHCEVCGKGFYDSSSMKKHVKGHARDGGGASAASAS